MYDLEKFNGQGQKLKNKQTIMCLTFEPLLAQMLIVHPGFISATLVWASPGQTCLAKDGLKGQTNRSTYEQP